MTRLAAAEVGGLPFVTVVKVANLDELGRIYMRIVSNGDAYRASFTVLAESRSERIDVVFPYRSLCEDGLVGDERLSALPTGSTLCLLTSN